MVFIFFWSLWHKWNIRSLVIWSLLLQVFLILFAPLRKKTANYFITFPLWLAYLLADLVATFAIGLISYHTNSCACALEVDSTLQAIWVSFLLLHLGGPDTIVAYSLEDSSLWLRHLLNLIFDVGAVIYIFMQIFPSNKSLVIPTMLVFVPAIIKYAERTLALNLSSLSRFRRSLLSQQEGVHSNLVEEIKVLGDGHSNGENAKLAESSVVKHAYILFQIFKVLLGDLIYTEKEREISRQYFNEISAVDALRVISVELNFIYEVLHTKALVIRSKWSYIFRFIAFTNIVISFIMFNQRKKRQLLELDVQITYSLLFGGIAIDGIALFMLIFSDWTVAEIKTYNKGSSKGHSSLNKLVSIMDYLRKPRFSKWKVQPNANVIYDVFSTRLIFRRWSESIYACNLFSMFLKESRRKNDMRNQCRFIVSCFRQFTNDGRDTIPTPVYVSLNHVITKLWIYIFQEVKRKSKDANDETKVRNLSQTRGEMFLRSKPKGNDCDNLLRYVTRVKYDCSILTWHIATEIWYNREKSKKKKREFSKILSDYMLYLLLKQSKVVSAVAGNAQELSAKTLLEMRTHFNDETMDMERLCNRLYEFPSEELNSTSPLYEGIKLAKSMERLEQDKWKVMSGVWVEMLSYAATHIKGVAHVQVLNRGGELLTFVWLLMAHFGCLYHPGWGIYHQRYQVYELPK